MSHKDHYTQYEGKDTWRGNGTTGTAVYDSNGSMRRLDVYTTKPGASHGHTWLKQESDGSWTYKYESHGNH